MSKCQFTYKGVTYECTGEDKDFQIRQFNHAISEQDFQTVENRIHNQITCWNCLKVIHTGKVLTKKEVENDRSSKYTYIDVKKKEEKTNKFW